MPRDYVNPELEDSLDSVDDTQVLLARKLDDDMPAEAMTRERSSFNRAATDVDKL